MMRSSVLLGLVLLTVAIPQEKPASAPARPAARPADVASVEAITQAIYDVISGPAGQKRDWDRFRSLFLPNARMIGMGIGRDKKLVVRDMSPEDYIHRAGPMLEGQGFFEREASKRIDRFGHIAQVFSTYESRRTAADEKPFQRGINSIQLTHDGERWHVASIIWDSESESQPIPAEYLK